MSENIERMARESDAEFARLTGIIFDLVKALENIAAMDAFGIRADDLGRAARTAREALGACAVGTYGHE